MEYKIKYFPLTLHPHCDCCWSLSAAADGRIYIAACCEHLPGGTVKCMRYNDKSDDIDFLFDLAEEVSDPYDSGRATQCKIHYSFAPSTDGIMYMATHLSGPPIDMPAYSPWANWNNPKRCFRGAALLAFDTKTDKTLWHDTLFPKEGCRCLLHDEQRGLLYALSYPRDHLFVYDIKARKSRDLGRIGSINSQCLFQDKLGRIWTTNDYGYFVRYNPATDRIEVSPIQIPYEKSTLSSWHGVLYDVVSSPENDCVYAVAWSANPRLIRFYPNEGKWGRVEDLGAVNQSYDPYKPIDYYINHVGGLVFASDGYLYLVGSEMDYLDDTQLPHTKNPTTSGAIWQYDTKTLKRKKVATLREEGKHSHYVSRGAMDDNGDLFFGTVDITARPNAIYKVELPKENKNLKTIPLRMWG